jgi:hypothetical protein
MLELASIVYVIILVYMVQEILIATNVPAKTIGVVLIVVHVPLHLLQVNAAIMDICFTTAQRIVATRVVVLQIIKDLTALNVISHVKMEVTLYSLLAIAVFAPTLGKEVIAVLVIVIYYVIHEELKKRDQDVLNVTVILHGKAIIVINAV